jgi:uncharacterized RDD family membrane protein YckC
MAWYYKDGEQEMGPVEKAELQILIKSQKVNARTLVREAQTDQWRPLADWVGRKSQSAQTPPPPPEQVRHGQGPAASVPGSGSGTHKGGAAGPEANQSTAVCTQCGRSFPRDQVLNYDNQVICAACKPMFVQKLKEGASLPATFKYAGFWIRFVAKFIDGLIMAAVQWAIMIPLGLMMASSLSVAVEQGHSGGVFALIAVQQIVGILIPAAYNTFFIGRFGATLGKMACQLRVVMPEGEKVSYMRALGRNFAEFISAITLLIGYIMAAFDSEKRALHDRICSTRVVHK